jgi:hypothetical protein
MYRLTTYGTVVLAHANKYKKEFSEKFKGLMNKIIHKREGPLAELPHNLWVPNAVFPTDYELDRLSRIYDNQPMKLDQFAEDDRSLSEVQLMLYPLLVYDLIEEVGFTYKLTNLGETVLQYYKQKQEEGSNWTTTETTMMYSTLKQEGKISAPDWYTEGRYISTNNRPTWPDDIPSYS